MEEKSEHQRTLIGHAAFLKPLREPPAPLGGAPPNSKDLTVSSSSVYCSLGCLAMLPLLSCANQIKDVAHREALSKICDGERIVVPTLLAGRLRLEVKIPLSNHVHEKFLCVELQEEGEKSVDVSSSGIVDGVTSVRRERLAIKASSNKESVFADALTSHQKNTLSHRTLHNVLRSNQICLLWQHVMTYGVPCCS